MKRALALLLLLALPTLAIPAHRLSLPSVVGQAEWVAVAKVLEIEEISDDGGSGLRIKVEIERSIHGQPPTSPATLTYWEGWPAQTPDGKVEAPIWSGSSLERQLNQGDEFLAIGSDTGLDRAEPLDAEAEIKKIIAERAHP